MLCLQFQTSVESCQGPISALCVRLKEEQEDIHNFLVGKLEILQLCLNTYCWVDAVSTMLHVFL